MARHYSRFTGFESNFNGGGDKNFQRINNVKRTKQRLLFVLKCEPFNDKVKIVKIIFQLIFQK